MIAEQSRQLFEELLARAQQIVLTTHINPDGDAIGSEIGLARFLVSRGKRVEIVNHDPTPEVLRFIEDPSLTIRLYDREAHDSLLRDADLVILVDNSAPDRLGRMERIMGEVAERTLCIDHHPMRSAPWAHLIVDVGCCATAEMIYELTLACGWQPDRLSAEAIYVGLATDTGFFRFNSTTARGHEVAAALLGLGVSPSHAFREIYERNSPAYTRLLGHALADLRVDPGGELAYVTIDRELVDRLDARDVDTSEMMTVLLALNGVQIVALFRELEAGKVKVSLRSKADHDVHALATEFGGGGHKNASGIVLGGDLAEVAELVIARARKRLG